MRYLIPISQVFVAVTMMIVVSASAVLADPSGPRMASANYAIDWSAVGEVSGAGGSSANYQLHEATIGQMAANTTSTSTNYALCTGWECSASVYAVYLPLILRAYP